MPKTRVDLGVLPIFEGVNPSLLRKLTPEFERDFMHGDVIFREGDAGESMFVVLHGQVAVTRDGIHLVTREAFDVLGEQACIDDTIRSATLEAIGSVKLLEIPGSLFDKLLDDARFARNLLGVLSGKLRGASEERAYRYAQEQELFNPDPQVANGNSHPTAEGRLTAIPVSLDKREALVAAMNYVAAHLDKHREESPHILLLLVEPRRHDPVGSAAGLGNILRVLTGFTADASYFGQAVARRRAFEADTRRQFTVRLKP